MRSRESNNLEADKGSTEPPDFPAKRSISLRGAKTRLFLGCLCGILVITVVLATLFSSRQVSPGWEQLRPLKPGCPVGEVSAESIAKGRWNEVFWSQWEQDRVLYNAFYSNPITCKKRFFLDVGANDGKIGSNSLFWERSLGWDVVAVEADWRMFQLLNSHRPLSRNVWAAVSNKYAKQNWVADGVTEGGQSGIFEGHSAWTDGQEGSSLLVHSTNTVMVMPLGDLIRRFQIDHVDILSLDIEGAEYAALSSVDFSEVQIDIINYECNNGFDCDPMRKLLREKEYVLWRYIIGDEVWVRKGFRGIEESCVGKACIPTEAESAGSKQDYSTTHLWQP